MERRPLVTHNSSDRPLRLMLTGGGTGGHLFPAVATAQRLCARKPDSQVLFVGTKRKLDRKHLERYGFSVAAVDSYGLKGKKLGALLKAITVLPVTFCQACYHIFRFRPDVVCGVGGYVTGPVVAAAWMMGKPTIIHEQNSVPGLANRKLGRIVDAVCLSLPACQSYFPAGKTVVTGNPVRSQIIDSGESSRQPGKRMTLLVLGGSQGARAINEIIVEVFSAGDRDLSDIEIIHQTGAADEAGVRKAYEVNNVNARVSAFFDDMADVYKRADLVVSRAGATTLAELAVLGKPAILIPYPHAADNHQEKNAGGFVEQGGALMFSQRDLTADILRKEIKLLIQAPETLETMSQSMKELGIPDAADRIVDLCLEMAGK